MAWALLLTALTTVQLPMAESGRRAAAMLLDHLDGEPLKNVTLREPRPHLVVRASTGPPPGGGAGR